MDAALLRKWLHLHLSFICSDPSVAVSAAQGHILCHLRAPCNHLMELLAWPSQGSSVPCGWDLSTSLRHHAPAAGTDSPAPEFSFRACHWVPANAPLPASPHAYPKHRALSSSLFYRFNHLHKFKEAEAGLETKQFFPNAPSKSLPLPTAFSATPSQKELSRLRNPTSFILLVLFIGSLLHFLQETGHFPEWTINQKVSPKYR